MIGFIAQTVGVSEAQVRNLIEIRGNGLQGLMSLSESEIRSVRGFGPKKAVRMSGALKLLSHNFEFDISKRVNSSYDAGKIFLSMIGGFQEDEKLAAICLNQRGVFLSRAILSRGSSRFVLVDPTQIFRYAVRNNACSIIIAHNHPSGEPAPSPQDISVTNKVAKAGKAIGIHLRDHIIVSGDKYRSMRDRGDAMF